MTIYTFKQKAVGVLHRIFCAPSIRHSFAKCGKGVSVPGKCSFSGIENIYVGDNVAFGVGTTVLTTRAKLCIGNDVMFGPNVTIVTGNHRIDMIGRTMKSITNEEKLPENDLDVTIENDVWIGANVTILKGVTVHRGSVISAVAVVTQDVPPYAIVGGVPAKIIKMRFTEEEIQKHEKILGKC